MDVFAHSVSGALLGRAVQPEGQDRKAFIIYCTLAALSPDIDAPIALLGHEAWFRWHQLFTHSLLGLIWVPLLLSLLPFRFAPWRIRFLLALSGWCLHVLLDVIARWPVPVAWPLSHQKWGFNFLASDFSWIIDMIMVFGLALSFWDPLQKHARWVSIATAIFIALWLGLGLPT